MSTPRADHPAAGRQPGNHYSGEVWNEVIARGEPPSRLVVGRATFTPGARTAWHWHPRGQVLVAETGTGRTQVAGEPARELHPGDSVSVGPGRLHWHGAAPDRVFVHLALQETDSQGHSATWRDHVTEAEYAGTAAHPAGGPLPAAVIRLGDATLFDDDLGQLELARARHALAYLQGRLGHEAMFALLGGDTETMDERVRGWIADSDGQWRTMTADLVVPGCSAGAFQRWYAGTVAAGRDDKLRAGHPEHFVNHPHGELIDVVENIGETELPWHVTYRSRPAEAAWPAGWDERFPVRFGAEILGNAGVVVGYSMRQARDEAGGLHLRATAFLPAAVPGHLLERHGRHLAIEYRNWIALAASELNPPPATRTPSHLQEDNDEF